MSHNRDHIIIQALIGTGQFSASEVETLEKIANKPEGTHSGNAAEIVGHMVQKKMREPDHNG